MWRCKPFSHPATKWTTWRFTCKLTASCLPMTVCWVPRRRMHHREEREQQILAALARGISGVKEITRHVYPRNLHKGLREGAERNVATHLAKLVHEGRVTQTPSSYVLQGAS